MTKAVLTTGVPEMPSRQGVLTRRHALLLAAGVGVGAVSLAACGGGSAFADMIDGSVRDAALQ